MSVLLKHIFKYLQCRSCMAMQSKKRDYKINLKGSFTCTIWQSIFTPHFVVFKLSLAPCNTSIFYSRSQDKLNSSRFIYMYNFTVHFLSCVLQPVSLLLFLKLQLAQISHYTVYFHSLSCPKMFPIIECVNGALDCQLFSDENIKFRIYKI